VHSKFNGGGHINHSLFWANLAPANFSQAELESAPKLTGAISAKYGSYDEFKDEFTGVLLGLQGSGFVCKNSNLVLTSVGSEF